MLIDNSDRVRKRSGTSVANFQANIVAETWDDDHEIYDAEGRHERLTDPRGVTDRLFDRENRLVRLTTPEGIIHYAYDPATSRHTRIWTSNTDVGYAIDNLGRLTEEDYDSSLPGLDFDAQYIMDLVGNRLEKNTTFAIGNFEEIDYAYNPLDQLLTEIVKLNGLIQSQTNSTYDLNGSQTGKVTIGGNSYPYQYNLQNRLYLATIDRTGQGQAVHVDSQFTYDDAGIRVRSNQSHTVNGGPPVLDNRLFLVDSNNPTGYAQILEELASFGGMPVLTYVLGRDVISQRAGMNSQFLLPDGLGSTRLLTDSAAAILARHSFDAYGIQLGAVPGLLSPAATQLLYTGEFFDSGLQNLYLRARYCDPSRGRFNRPDPISGSPNVSARPNVYSYVDGDPITLLDPAGLLPIVPDADVGKAVHKVLYEEYTIWSPNTLTQFGRAIFGTSLLPDIVDITRREIGEIKSTGEALGGLAKLQLYIDVANGRSRNFEGKTYHLPSPWYDARWKPSQLPVGVRAVFPGTVDPSFATWVAITVRNYHGVIVYKLWQLPTDKLVRQFARVAEPVVRHIASQFRNLLSKSESLLADLMMERELAHHLGGSLALVTAGYGTYVYLYPILAPRLISLARTARLTLGSFTLAFAF
jgi:RHS repeat-associated protein